MTAPVAIAATTESVIYVFIALALAAGYFCAKASPLISAKETAFKPYPKGQHGFARRAILGEWVKFSLQMNIQEETIRQNLVTLCFELISKIDYSYADYEHLLRQKKQQPFWLNSEFVADATLRRVAPYENRDSM